MKINARVGLNIISNQYKALVWLGASNFLRGVQFASRSGRRGEEMPVTFRQSIELAAFPETFLLFPEYVPEVLLEADAVHERTSVFPILVLLGRAVRTKALRAKHFSRLSSVPVIFMTGPTPARSANRFAVGTGAWGMAIGRG